MPVEWRSSNIVLSLTHLGRNSYSWPSTYEACAILIMSPLRRMGIKMPLNRPDIYKRMSRKGWGVESGYDWNFSTSDINLRCVCVKHLRPRLHKRDTGTSWIFQGQGCKMEQFCDRNVFSLAKKNVGHTLRSSSWDQKKIGVKALSLTYPRNISYKVSITR
jgi:hypothetical protein